MILDGQRITERGRTLPFKYVSLIAADYFIYGLTLSVDVRYLTTELGVSYFLTAQLPELGLFNILYTILLTYSLGSILVSHCGFHCGDHVTT